MRTGAGPSDSPLHPMGLAQLACAWLGGWESEGEARIVAIKQLEKKVGAALPKLLPNGLAILEKHLVNNGSNASTPYGSAGGAKEDVGGGLPDDVLPLAEQGGKGWLDTLNEAQDGLYEQAPTALDGGRGGYTPDYGHLLDRGVGNEPDMPANSPMYLDDLIRARSAHQLGHGTGLGDLMELSLIHI